MNRRLRTLVLALLALGLCLFSAASLLTSPTDTYAAPAAQDSCPSPGGGTVKLVGIQPDSIRNTSACHYHGSWRFHPTPPL